MNEDDTARYSSTLESGCNVLRPNHGCRELIPACFHNLPISRADVMINLAQGIKDMFKVDVNLTTAAMDVNKIAMVSTQTN